MHSRTKLINCIVWVCFLLSICPLTAFAADPATHVVDVTVEIDETGGANVTENWDVTTVAGTEFYLAKYYLKDQEILNLSVSDDSGRTYENIGSWDSGRSLAAKNGQCGLIQINDGYEICWGIGSNYGHHVYSVKYHMTNIVKSYNDYDALYQQFVSQDLLAKVEHLNIFVDSSANVFTGENTKVWGFGFSGEINVIDGKVVCENTEALYSDDYAALLIRFDKGMFSPVKSVSSDFEDVRQEALIGSGYSDDRDSSDGGDYYDGGNDFNGDNYSNGDNNFAYGYGGTEYPLWESVGSGISHFFTYPFPFLIFCFPVLFVIFFVIFGKGGSADKTSKRIMDKQTYSMLPICRELPFGGSLTATYVRFTESGGRSKIGDLIGSYILRWLNMQLLEMIQDQGSFKKSIYGIRFLAPPMSMPHFEWQLYDMLAAAANSDGVLLSNDFRKWSSDNYDRFDTWLETVKNDGKAWLRQTGNAEFMEKKSLFGTKMITLLNARGEEMTDRMYGFKKYLEGSPRSNEPSNFNESNTDEAWLLNEYLVFAQLFGIAEATAQRFSEGYQARQSADSGYQGWNDTYRDGQAAARRANARREDGSYGDPIGGGGYQPFNRGATPDLSRLMTAVFFSNMFSRSMNKGYTEGKRAAESSSSGSSFGGGGGFSGGGGMGSSGGGSFGGGGTR